MVRVRPFRPLRPPVTLAAEVSAAAFEKPEHGLYPEIAPTKGLSYKRILAPGLFETRALTGQEFYQKAWENLQEFLEKEFLVREDEPAFYVYCQTSRQTTFTGIIGTFAISEYENGAVKKHELTQKGKEKAIAAYFQNVGISGSPVMLTFPENQQVSKLMDQAKEGQLLYNFLTKDGLYHRLWKISAKEAVEKIEEAFSTIPALYIADGHHRCAAYANYAKSKGNEENAYGMAFMLPDNEVSIYGFHRLLKDLNGWEIDQLLKSLQNDFAIEPLSEESFPQKPGEMVFVAYDQWFCLKPREHLQDSHSYKASLDVYQLDEYLLKPYMGIGGDKGEDKLTFMEGTVGIQELKAKMVGEGFNVAFLLHPIPINTLMKLSDNGETLPPKSTWIEPKLRSGLTIHELE